MTEGRGEADALSTSPARTNSGLAEWLCLAVVVVAAAWLRFHDLGNNPPGMFRDELEKGYTALELWRTGRHGYFDGAEVVRSGPMPVFIDVFGDKTSAIYQYLSAPLVGWFGLSRTTTRLAAALCGLATVLAVWALVRRWHGPMIGIFAAGLVAMMPQAIIFSRWAQQGVTVPLFTTLGVLAYWGCFHGQSRHRTGLAMLSGFLLGVAFYAYDPARVGVPLIAIGLLAGLGWAGLRANGRLLAIWGATFLAIALPVFLYAIGGEGSHRFQRVSVFNNGIGPGLLKAAAQYFEHFHPRFLIGGGDANPRHQLPALKSGIMQHTFGMVLIASGYGIWLRVRSGRATRGDRARWLLLAVWLIGAPLAAAFTTGGIPHALRAILFVPVWCFLAVEGLAEFNRPANRSLPLIFGGVVAVNFAAALLGVNGLKTRRPSAWQSGVLERLGEALESPPSTPVYLSATVPYAPYFALFAERTDPAAFQEDGLAALRTRILPPDDTALRGIPVGSLLVKPDPRHSPWAEGEPPIVVIEITASGPRFRP